MRALIVAVFAALLLAAPASAKPPKMPSSTKHTKRCGIANNGFADFRVFVTKGKSRISCRKARRVVSVPGPAAKKPWTYYDWTKGGNPPWSDVWQRRDNKVVIGAIVKL
jgi:hypothetical protein